MKPSVEKLAKIFLIVSIIFCFSAVLGTIETAKELMRGNKMSEVLNVKETTIRNADFVKICSERKIEFYNFCDNYSNEWNRSNLYTYIDLTGDNKEEAVINISQGSSFGENIGITVLQYKNNKLSELLFTRDNDFYIENNQLVTIEKAFIGIEDTQMEDIQRTYYVYNKEKNELEIQKIEPIFNKKLKDKKTELDKASKEVEKTIKDKANKVIMAIKNKDFTSLAKFVHPEKGVRFSPYTAVYEEDIFFTKEQIKNLYQSNTEYIWGYRDGSGFPIKETFKDYYSEFVYDQDFVNAKEVGYNQRLGSGNTIDSTSEFYKDSIRVEYHFSGFNPDYEGMDWESLVLIFQEKDSVWYLVGIVHDQWTI